MSEQHEIERFEGEGGLVHMSDGRNLRRQDVDDYKKTHPGVQVTEQQSPVTDPVTKKLTQGGE